MVLCSNKIAAYREFKGGALNLSFHSIAHTHTKKAMTSNIKIEKEETIPSEHVINLPLARLPPDIRSLFSIKFTDGSSQACMTRDRELLSFAIPLMYPSMVTVTKSNQKFLFTVIMDCALEQLTVRFDEFVEPFRTCLHAKQIGWTGITGTYNFVPDGAARFIPGDITYSYMEKMKPKENIVSMIVFKRRNPNYPMLIDVGGNWYDVRSYSFLACDSRSYLMANPVTMTQQVKQETP